MSITEVVETSYGPVRGIKRKSRVGEDFYSFLGIPYAKAPIGDLRFKDPQPPEPWHLVHDATAQGKCAIGWDIYTNFTENLNIVPNSGEDCLFVNVYTKELKPQNPLPVMVWIHGGAFKNGSGDEFIYGPDYLLQKNIVFVSLNYRLGALGFMSINDPSVNVPGNAGLKDQTLALKWVRQNIERFGGDAQNVTIFGESAGGASVHFHMVSELSRGLFDKAIIQSGSVLCNWTQYPNLNWAERLAKKLGWTGGDGPRGAYDFLKEADAKDIFREQDNLIAPEEQLMGLATFGPVVEPYNSEQTFIDKPYQEMLVNPWSVNVPLIIGATSDEGLLFWRLFKSNKQFLMSPMGMYGLLGEMALHTKPDSPAKVIEFYFGPEGPQENDLAPLTQLWGDRCIWHGVSGAIEARLKCNGAKTFVYRFALDSPVLTHLKLAIMRGDIAKGACHGDDLLYLFRPEKVNEVVDGSVEAGNIERMVTIWTEFAKTGDPNTSILSPLVWEPAKPIDGANLKGLNINDELKIIDFPEVPRIAFWNSLLKI